MPINNWMPVYTRDILASCADMSATQFGAYMRLLLWAWDSGGLPNDMEACCRIAGGLSPSDWAVVRKRLVVLDAGTSEERLSHPRLEREREKQQQGYDRKVAAIAKARAAKQSTDDSPVDRVVDRVVVNDVNSPVNKTEQEQEPEPEQDRTLKSSSRRRTKARPPTAARISWTAAGGFANVCEISRAAWKAAFPLIDIDKELAKCHAHAVANPLYARRTDWNRTVKAWLSKAQEYAELGHVTAAPLAAPKRRYFRADAHQNLTDEEYARWKSGATSLGDAIRERTRRAAGPAAE